MTLLLVLVFLLFTAPLSGQSAESEKGFQPLTAALHVHSRFSNGEHEILELGSHAHQKKIDVLGISDSFLTRVRYGVGPFKKLMSRTLNRTSVMDRGIDQYFESVEHAQQQFSDVVILPGFEVAPYYYWEGRWPGTLALHDFDRHLLVFGLRDREAARNMPVIENATWSNSERSLSRVVGPGIALLLGFALFTRRSKAARLAAGFILVVGGAWTYDAYPYANLPTPYSDKTDDRAYQRLIDYAAAHGALTFWSYPEARYPDITVTGSPARMASRPEPEILGRTDDYRGFEGLYGDNITITRPGSLWDQLLKDYVQNGRKTWPSVITGIDFHSFKPANGWYQLDHGITVLFAGEKSEAAVLEALKLGRGYASFQDKPDHAIVLQDFALRSNGNVAISGESLQAARDVNFTAKVEGPADAKAQISVIRDGALLEQVDATLPAVINRSDTLDAGHHYYRLMVKAGASQILSNPIFCAVTQQAAVLKPR
jgi:hypothetical protein